jgi:glycosyltransferase involved in cell wall biosynthesis
VKRVLVLTYFFPPIGGAGGQRPLRLVQHLRAHGYEPVVLSSPGQAEDRWTPEDAALARDIPHDVEVRRVPLPEPSAGGSRGRLERIAGIPQPWSRWWADQLVREGCEIGSSCDLIWVVMQPYQSARPAAELAAKLRLPWVADLADPWALDEMLIYPTALHRRVEMRRMRRVLSSADGIIMSTPEAASRLTKAFCELRSRPIGVGPHGWERSDFAGPAPIRSDTSFRIVHTGYLHTELGLRQQRTARLRRMLGGGRDRAQIMTRSHVCLLKALEGLFTEQPHLRDRVELHLAGVQSRADREAVGSSSVVKMLGYVSHADSVALIRSADLLFLPMHSLPRGVRAGLVPGKTYEYLASGRPILAAVPEGDARDILAASGNAFICRPSDTAAMQEILTDRIASFLAGKLDPQPVGDVADRYEYSRLAGELASFFDEVLARSGAV